jgi:hypothetical protein
VQFFALDALPAGVGSNTRERLALLSEQ